MPKRLSRRALLRSGAVAGTVGFAGCTNPLGGPAPEELVRERASELDPLSDVSEVIGRGYQPAGPFIRSDSGGVGVPFVNNQIEPLQESKPQSVLVDLADDGTYVPLGLKWFVPADQRDDPPSLFGTQFDGPLPAEGALIPEHYALHVWLFEDNPKGLFAIGNPDVSPPPFDDDLTTVTDAIGEYILGNAAENDGYVNTETCISTGDGGYGVPFVKEDADGTGGTDLADPPVLLYRLTSNWSYQLMGAEWYVPAADTDGPPSAFGQSFHGAMAGHSDKTEQPEHYGLHAWIYRANSGGLFAPFNTTVTC